MCDCGCGASCNAHCWNESEWSTEEPEDLRGQLAYIDEDVEDEEAEGCMEEPDQFLHDGEADGDALKSAGWGTDEDYHLEEYGDHWGDM